MIVNHNPAAERSARAQSPRVTWLMPRGTCGLWEPVLYLGALLGMLLIMRTLLLGGGTLLKETTLLGVSV